MVIFRISNFPKLDGMGSILFAGRWNLKGTPLVYCSESVALAYYEVSVHSGSLASFNLNVISFPNQLAFDCIEEADLPNNWRENQGFTQKIGEDWVKSQKSALLKVPSSLFPHSYNLLINTLHKDIARFSVITEKASADNRLLPLKDADVILKKQNSIKLSLEKKLGDILLAYQWLGLPHLSLEGKIPLNMMNNLTDITKLEIYVNNLKA